jgi:hypothetical protein
MLDTIKTADIPSRKQPALKPHTRAGKNVSIRINIVCAELKTLLAEARAGNCAGAIAFVNRTSKVASDMVYLLGRPLTSKEKVSLLECAEYIDDVEFSRALSIARVWQVERQLARILVRSMAVSDRTGQHNYGGNFPKVLASTITRFISDIQLSLSYDNDNWGEGESELISDY